MKPLYLVELTKFSKEGYIKQCIYDSDDISIFLWCFEKEQETEAYCNKKNDEAFYFVGGKGEMVLGSKNIETVEMMMVPVLKNVSYKIKNPGPGRLVVLSYKSK
jgi:mannose-6-phosphate isomerase-like protein (cupin superfamily)